MTSINDLHKSWNDAVDDLVEKRLLKPEELDETSLNFAQGLAMRSGLRAGACGGAQTQASKCTQTLCSADDLCTVGSCTSDCTKGSWQCP